MIPHEGRLRVLLESWLIGVAIRILKGRNVPRSLVVSRRDNNEMWGMAESLEDIQKRIATGYAHE